MRKIILLTALCGFSLPVMNTQAEEIDFEKQIYPLIKASCVKCHKPAHEDERGRTRKPMLPIDDDMHFPPEGKAPQWTAADKELFAKWITEGADFGDWTEDPDPLTDVEWDGKEK